MVLKFTSMETDYCIFVFLYTLYYAPLFCSYFAVDLRPVVECISSVAVETCMVLSVITDSLTDAFRTKLPESLAVASIARDVVEMTPPRDHNAR